MQPDPKSEQPARDKRFRDQTSIEEGRRLSRTSFIAYGMAIVIALLFGGALFDANPWGNAVTIILVPFSSLLVLIGLGLNVVAIQRGATSAGVWRLVVGLTLVPVLILGALGLSMYIYYSL